MRVVGGGEGRCWCEVWEGGRYLSEIGGRGAVGVRV